MFGKPEWFEEGRLGFGLKPVSWQGWAYSGGWVAVIALPTLALMSQRLGVESLIWMAAAITAAIWDVRSIWREKQPQQPDDVLYIDDDEAAPEQFASRNFKFRLRG